jgi:uncharacterized protein (UPF0276 family)
VGAAVAAAVAADALAAVPALGAGLGYREAFRGDLFLHQGQVDFLEVCAEHYLDGPAGKLRELDLLAEHFTLVPHGLSLSLGSAEGLDLARLEKLARLIERLEPPYWSEHIALTRAGGVEIGHLSPLPLTREAVAALCRNLRVVQERIPAPLILENITHPFQFPNAELTEAEFLSEVVERSGCGLLLDVTNVYVNSVNHGFDAEAFLDALPLERVVQLHFVGVRSRSGRCIDDHASPTPPEIWDLMERVTARAPVKGIILERDLDLPPFDQLLAEVGRAREIGRRHGRWP